MSKLGKKLFLVFLILVLLSLVLVGFFINYSIGERFYDFVNLQRQESIEELVLMLRERIQAESINTASDILDNFSRTNRTLVWLEDADGNLIFSPEHSAQMNNMMRRSGMRMGNNMPMMNIQRPESLPGQTKKEEILIDDELAAVLYWKEINAGSQIDSELYNYFKRNVFQAIIFSGLIVVVLIIIISFIISKILTDPLIKLKNAALEVADGNYDQKISNKGNDELSELIKAFNEMTKKLAKLEKIRKESASDFAHELRTPVTTIKGYLEAIEDEMISLDKNNLKEMKEETERIISLIEKLKEFAEAQNKIFNLQKEDLNLTDVIENVLKRKEKDFEEKNLELELDIEDELIINADKDSLFQIFNNLIENAVKYNKENGSIKISSEQKKDKITITIADTGQGISDEDLPYIFERFYRADKSRSTENGGTGIGLAVTKELIDAHQAEIYVESDDSGSKFIVEFPI
jgi:signal transduction histidine kinase